MLEQRWRLRRTTRRQLIAGGLAVFSPIGIGTLCPARYLGRLYPGDTMLGLDLGGLTRAEAATRPGRRLAPFLAQPVTLRLGKRTWTPAAADLGIPIDVKATLDRACRHGRGDGILRRHATLMAAANARFAVPVVFVIDDGNLQTFVDALGNDVARERAFACAVMRRRMRFMIVGCSLEFTALARLVFHSRA